MLTLLGVGTGTITYSAIVDVVPSMFQIRDMAVITFFPDNGEH
jgi:hypothetical protein